MALIHEKIIAIMADADAIGKDRRNQTQGFNFRGIDDVYNSLHPILAKHGVFSTTQVLAERSEERQTAKGGNLIYRILTVKFTFFCADGSSVESIITGEGMDSGDKASNKALAIAHKYALLQLLAIPTEDSKDPDAESHEVKGKATPQATKPITQAPSTTPQAKPLSNTNPLGTPSEAGLMQRCADLAHELDLTRDVYVGIVTAHKKDWGKVLAELQERKRLSLDAVEAVFDGATVA